MGLCDRGADYERNERILIEAEATECLRSAAARAFLRSKGAGNVSTPFSFPCGKGSASRIRNALKRERLLEKRRGRSKERTEPKRKPAKRLRFGKDEQRNVRAFAFMRKRGIWSLRGRDFDFPLCNPLKATKRAAALLDFPWGCMFVFAQHQRRPQLWGSCRRTSGD